MQKENYQYERNRVQIERYIERTVQSFGKLRRNNKRERENRRVRARVCAERIEKTKLKRGYHRDRRKKNEKK